CRLFKVAESPVGVGLSFHGAKCAMLLLPDCFEVPVDSLVVILYGTCEVALCFLDEGEGLVGREGKVGGFPLCFLIQFVHSLFHPLLRCGPISTAAICISKCLFLSKRRSHLSHD